MTIECVGCGRDVYEEALDENLGDCPYCETFLTPPTTVLQQWQSIRLSGVTNMLEWDTVLNVALRHDLHSLVAFLTDESAMPTEQIEALSRGLSEGDIDPYIDPNEVRRKHEEVESQVEQLRQGKDV